MDDNLHKEHAMLAQGETETKAPFANRNGKPDRSYGLDPQFAKIKKELFLAQREIANLKNQLHQAKENMAKERAERSSKDKKDSQEDEVGDQRVCQQAKRGKKLRQGPSSPSLPRKGFKVLPTGDYSDSEEEEDYHEKTSNIRQGKVCTHSTNHPTIDCPNKD
jgi:hypothetical protein